MIYGQPTYFIFSIATLFLVELPTFRCLPESASDTSQVSTFSETCYKFSVGKGSSFSVARSNCKQENGDLIHTMSPSQTDFLISQLDRRKSNLTTQLVWIGAQKEPRVISRTWKWVNGKYYNNCLILFICCEGS